MSSQNSFSVSARAYEWIADAAMTRGIPIAQLVEQALALPGAWTIEGVRSTAEAFSEAAHHRSRLPAHR